MINIKHVINAICNAKMLAVATINQALTMALHPHRLRVRQKVINAILTTSSTTI